MHVFNNILSYKLYKYYLYYLLSPQVRTKKDNVAGVSLPVFESYQEGGDSYELTGKYKLK